MRSIHKHQLMHRDLKPSNILLSKNMHVHISDLSLKILQSKGFGTMRFMAPELFEENNIMIRYDNKVDVYSFGITLAYIITEQYPNFSLKNKIFNCRFGSRTN